MPTRRQAGDLGRYRSRLPKGYSLNTYLCTANTTLYLNLMTRKALLYLITVMLLSGSLALAQTKPTATLVKQYLDFLYQYLPLPDRCDYSLSLIHI